MSRTGVSRAVLPFRRQRSWQRRVSDVARNAPKKGRELRAAAAQLDVPWARSAPARLVRENFMRFVLNPLMDYYAARRATGREKLSSLKGPVILVANHASHMDTPVILSALPRKLRKRTAVAAAADYFYRNRARRLGRVAHLQHGPDRAQGRRRDVQGRRPPRPAAGPGLEPAALSRGHPLAGRRPGTGAPRSSRPGRRRTTSRSSPSGSPAPPRRCRRGGCGHVACAAS